MCGLISIAIVGADFKDLPSQATLHYGFGLHIVAMLLMIPCAVFLGISYSAARGNPIKALNGNTQRV